MPLSPAQNLAIKADILALPELNIFPNTDGGAWEIKELYNRLAVPDFFVWKTYLREIDITGMVSPEGTTWSWPAFIARSLAEHTGWARMFNGTYSFDPSLPQNRVGFADIFSGGTGVAQRAHITAMSKEKSTRLEKLLADISGGAGTLIAPATRTFVGKVTYQEIFAARNWV